MASMTALLHGGVDVQRMTAPHLERSPFRDNPPGLCVEILERSKPAGHTSTNIISVILDIVDLGQSRPWCYSSNLATKDCGMTIWRQQQQQLEDMSNSHHGRA